MNKHLFKGIAVAVVSTVVLTTFGAVKLYAEDKLADKIDKEAVKEQLSGVIVAGNQADKEETVYVITDAAGSVNKVIVSNHLYNIGKDDKLNDVSDLKDIINMKGYEDFTANGNQLSWNAQGNAIYYQGTSEKPLPVAIKIRYFLNGEEKNATEIAGAKGHVTVRFEYENQLQVTLKDSNEKYYVPFVALTGAFLDTDTFKNISVTNGRIVDDGDRVYCMGIALPGLKDDLGVSDDSINIPEYFEISADTTGFELLTTLSMVTNEPFNHIDLTGIDTSNPAGCANLVSQLKEAATKLTDGAKAIYNGLVELKAGMEALKEGATSLQSGANALHSGTGNLLTGAGQLQAGIGQVNTGAGQLHAGANQVSNGATALNTGLNTLTQNSTALNAGAKQIFESLLASATTQLQGAGLPVEQLTIENYAVVLDNTAAYLTSVGMAPASQQVMAVKAQLDSVNAFYTGLNAYTQGVDQAATGAGQLAAGSQQLAAGLGDLSQGTNQLVAGADSLVTGAEALNSGAGQLASGTDSLIAGIDQLLAGTDKLTEGAKTLSDALDSINDEANNLIIELSDNLLTVFERLNNTIEVSKTYNNYSGLADGMKGCVKFIYRTGAVSSEK